LNKFWEWYRQYVTEDKKAVLKCSWNLRVSLIQKINSSSNNKWLSQLLPNSWERPSKTYSQFKERLNTWEKLFRNFIIICLSWNWASCWPDPFSHIQKSFQWSPFVPSAFWSTKNALNKVQLMTVILLRVSALVYHTQRGTEQSSISPTR